MSSQQSRIDVLAQVLESAKAWLHAFDTEQIGVIDEDKYRAYRADLTLLQEIGIDVTRWVDIPANRLSPNNGRIHDYVIFGIRVRSLVSFLERQLEHETQVQAVGGASLTDEQMDLLRLLVMANRNVAAAQRQEIVGLSADGETRFFHPGLPNRSLAPNMVDLKRLAQLGLVEAHDRGGKKGWIINVLPPGEAVIDAVQPRTLGRHDGEPSGPVLPEEYRYHVAISYAGPDIQHAEDLATLLEQESCKVFFDKAKPEETWGKNLHSFFQEVFAEQALYCVLFVSEEYKNREWTNKELQDALSRQVKLRGSGEYILPIQLEKEVKLPGLPTSIGYLSIEEYSIETMRDVLIRKIEARANK